MISNGKKEFGISQAVSLFGYLGIIEQKISEAQYDLEVTGSMVDTVLDFELWTKETFADYQHLCKWSWL